MFAYLGQEGYAINTVTIRTMDRHGQMFRVPEIDIDDF